MFYASIIFLVELAVKNKTDRLAVAEKNNRKSKVHESYVNDVEQNMWVKDNRAYYADAPHFMLE